MFSTLVNSESYTKLDLARAYKHGVSVITHNKYTRTHKYTNKITIRHNYCMWS